ncbi:hypothetical protein FACS1894151_11080 [Spirochaetia bacterium]|nr:hypothetical protein FACS1894151_11080 [Spirochaetia bacterium]
MIYLARKNGTVVYHTDIKAMGDLDGVEPEKTITNEEWDASGGLARIVNGDIFLGKTEVEKDAERREELFTAAKAKQDRLFADTVDRKCNAARWQDMDEATRTAWIDYRRALSDIDEQPGYPETINWPVPPEQS